MAAPESSSDPKDKTPEKFSTPEDARKKEGAGKYPNYWTHRTRSGHILTFDDSKDNEHVTLQHRGGSMIQFMPDGAVQFVSHNGQYNVVFGEHRVKITGAYDVVVEGGGSLKIDGDYDVTVKGNHNHTVKGDYNVMSKNFNQTVRGNIDVQAQNETKKIEGNIATTALGAISTTAKMGIGIKSTSDSIGIRGAKQIGIESEGGELMLKAGGKFSVLASGEMAMATDAAFGIKTGAAMDVKSGGEMKFQGGNKIKLNSGASPAEPDDPANKFKFTKPPSTSKEPDVSSA